LRNKRTGEITKDGMVGETWELADGDKVTYIVLTIAHLDHTPENCADDNLKALCQRCHLAYDHDHHQQNAAQTRRKGKAIRELFA
jgi:glyoxylase-like metal-dependent hydrolase (beta-lactamase superfamily II)